MNRVDELVNQARLLESLRAELVDSRSCVRPAKTRDSISNDWYMSGVSDGISEAIKEIDRRTVTLSERIYAELVYDEVPFEED